MLLAVFVFFFNSISGFVWRKDFPAKFFEKLIFLPKRTEAMWEYRRSGMNHHSSVESVQINIFFRINILLKMQTLTTVEFIYPISRKIGNPMVIPKMFRSPVRLGRQCLNLYFPYSCTNEIFSCRAILLCSCLLAFRLRHFSEYKSLPQ